MCWQFNFRQLSTENPLGLLGREYPRDTLWGRRMTGEQTGPADERDFLPSIFLLLSVTEKQVPAFSQFLLEFT